jgi:hypothetical protein
MMSLDSLLTVLPMALRAPLVAVKLFQSLGDVIVPARHGKPVLSFDAQFANHHPLANLATRKRIRLVGIRFFSDLFPLSRLFLCSYI